MSPARDLLLIDSEGRELSLTERPIRIGSASDCDVRLGRSAAPIHVRVSHEKVEAFAECVVGSVPLEPGRSRSLVGPCKLRIGGVELRIEERWDLRSASTRRIALELVKLVTVPEIVIVEGDDADVGRTLPLSDVRDYVIGRASSCDLVLDDIAISREHLVVTTRGGKVLARDRASTRGTFLGATRLDAGRSAVWSAEHMLRIGRTVLALRLPEEQEVVLAHVVEPPAAPGGPAPGTPAPAAPACEPPPEPARGPAPPSVVEASEADGPMASVPEAHDESRAARPRVSHRPRSALEIAGVLALALLAVATAGILVYVIFASSP